MVGSEERETKQRREHQKREKDTVARAGDEKIT
jgi:hypothetical protein